MFEAYVFDLVYRLTIALSLLDARREEIEQPWLFRLHGILRARAVALLQAISSSDVSTLLEVDFAADACRALNHDLLVFSPYLPDQEKLTSWRHQYQRARDQLRRSILGSGDVPVSPLYPCYVVARWLAVMDLRAWPDGGSFAYENVLRVRDGDMSIAEALPLFLDRIPWPEDNAYRTAIERYLGERERYTVDEEWELSSGCFDTLRHRMLPDVATAVWIVPLPVEETVRQHVFFGPHMLEIKNRPEHGLLTLLRTMAQDKAENLPPEECGWCVRNDLFGVTAPSGVSRAWKELTENAEFLGRFEYQKVNPKLYHKHESLCRAPAALAFPERRILFESRAP